ncbi:MAG TPA: hypothetical protein VN922_20740 [Bacteroidia bacterium]|nr:hypothetical protein [Bacteroidia bacterium]
MKPLKAILFLLPLLFVVQSCHKTIVVVPLASMKLSADTLHLKDTLTITNYSKSDEAYVYIIDSTNACYTSYKTYQGALYPFTRFNKLQYTFTDPGFYHVYIRAINNQTYAPIKTDSATVRVLP